MEFHIRREIILDVDMQKKIQNQQEKGLKNIKIIKNIICMQIGIFGISTSA